MKAVFEVLAALIRLLERFLLIRKQKDRQVKRDKLEDNPVDFFNDHFDGVRNDKSKDSTSEADTDSKTNK